QQPEIVIPEAANLHAALEWSLERDEIEFGLELLVALEQFWVLGYTDEGMRWFRSFLERADEVPPLLRARALRSFGSSAHFAGDRRRVARRERDAGQGDRLALVACGNGQRPGRRSALGRSHGGRPGASSRSRGSRPTGSRPGRSLVVSRPAGPCDDARRANGR